MRNKTKKNMIAISVGAAGAGAGLMFLLDPSRGGRRRGIIGEKTVGLVKFIGKRFRRQSRDLENRAHGAVAERSARMMREAAQDEVLAERVRAKLGRVLSHPRALDITAERGIVEMRGAVLRSERRRAVRAAESARGVHAVQHDALRTYSDEEGIPGLRPLNRSSEAGQARASRKMRGLRLGIVFASGALAAYRAFKRSSQPRDGQTEHRASSDRAA